MTCDGVLLGLTLLSCGLSTQAFGMIGKKCSVLGAKKVSHAGWKVERSNVLSGLGAGIVNFPTVSSMKSQKCAPDEQGQVLGSLSGVQSLSMCVGPLIFNNLVRPRIHCTSTLLSCRSTSSQLPTA